MLNRRYLRIKVFQAVYSYWQSEGANITAMENAMFTNIGHTYDLYIALLQVFPELHRAANERIQERKKKRLPTAEDLKPNLKFVTNKALASVLTSSVLKEEGAKRKINWVGEKELMHKLFRTISESEIYKSYMDSSEEGFHHDRSFLVKLFVNEIANYEGLHDLFEERSIYWLEDLDLACAMVKRTIENISGEAGKDIKLKELYSAPGEEEEFVRALFRNTIEQDEEHEQAISAKAKNWEADRIALSDMLLMKMALSEVRAFSMIPVKVTMNEYIEIAKAYSTPKSKNFINGILDKLFTEMRENGSIKKVGRGLIDNK
jgi:N utilization substance protein B